MFTFVCIFVYVSVCIYALSSLTISIFELHFKFPQRKFLSVSHCIPSYFPTQFPKPEAHAEPVCLPHITHRHWKPCCSILVTSLMLTYFTFHMSPLFYIPYLSAS